MKYLVKNQSLNKNTSGNISSPLSLDPKDDWVCTEHLLCPTYCWSRVCSSNSAPYKNTSTK